MPIPLNIDELALLLAVISAILLATSEVLSPHYGRVHAQVFKKRLRRVAFGTSIAFLFVAALRVVSTYLA
ncbi:hypothetical protein KAU25_05525 [Candidatus Bathyarchaeota archaeon]|nr:hypothetical protein [Candidatus Bathyarchaeota archaeon]